MKIALFTTLLLASTPTLAVVNGTPVNWSSQDDTVRLDASDNASKYCTATMIAGRYALTAAHCFANDSGLDAALTAAGKRYDLNTTVNHPNFVYKEDSLSTEDVALAVLDDALDYRHIHFLNVDELTEAEPVSISGFGGTKESLNRADFTYSHSYFWYDFLLYLDMVNDSHTTGGDSGSAC
ncbi:possible trypsin protease [Vibrio astriarenae]|nr:possible trypsin protease [Vibrio sp. C7]